MESLELLYQEKNIKLEELEAINERINSLINQIKNNCLHQFVNQDKDYDGHTWKTSYYCDYCHKEFHHITNQQTIINMRNK